MSATTQGWIQLVMLLFTIVGCSFALGRLVQDLRGEIRLNRIDLAMLFRHFGLIQPSQVLAETRSNGKVNNSILGSIIGK